MEREEGDGKDKAYLFEIKKKQSNPKCTEVLLKYVFCVIMRAKSAQFSG